MKCGMARPRRTRVAVACAIVSSGVLLAGCGGSGSQRSASLVSKVNIGISACGGRWTTTRGGRAEIAVTSHYGATQIAEVYLANARTGAVYDEVDGLAPGSTYTLTATLGRGRYELQCYVSDDNPLVGPVVRVEHGASGSALSPGVVPITFADLVPPTKAYQKWVESRLPVLLRQVDALAAQVQHGATPAAKSAWLTAHLTYERLGAAYDAFGPLDTRINGFPQGSESWRHDRELTGFHLVEGLLWSGAPAGKLEPAVAQLRMYVQRLIKHFATVNIQPYEIALRAHEIIENAIQFELTGATDEGSNTNLATVGANLYGSRKTLSFIVPLLRTRFPKLAETERALTASERLIRSFDHNGHWTPLQSLSVRQRESVDASLEGLVELLSRVAAIGDIRNVPVGDGQ
jgi:iron uptake system component EfeO